MNERLLERVAFLLYTNSERKVVDYMPEHESIKEQIKRNETRLNNHSERIKQLEYYRTRTEVQVENLIKEIASLVSTMRWTMGLLVTTLVALFIWYIQSL